MDVTPQRTSSVRRRYLSALSRKAGGRQDGYDSDEGGDEAYKDFVNLRRLRIVSIALESQKVCTVQITSASAPAPMTPPQIPGYVSPKMDAAASDKVCTVQATPTLATAPTTPPQMPGYASPKVAVGTSESSDAGLAAAFASLQLRSPSKRMLEKQEL